MFLFKSGHMGEFQDLGSYNPQPGPFLWLRNWEVGLKQLLRMFVDELLESGQVQWRELEQEGKLLCSIALMLTATPQSRYYYYPIVQEGHLKVKSLAF